MKHAFGQKVEVIDESLALGNYRPSAIGRGLPQVSDNGRFARDSGQETASVVNHSHTATTELFDDAVVRDGLADHCGQIAVGDTWGGCA